MPDAPNPRRTRLGAAAALLGALTAVATVGGAGSAPSLFQAIGANEDLSGNCDELEHATDPGCLGVVVTAPAGATTSTTDTTLDDSTTSTTTGDAAPDPVAPAPGSDIRAIDAAGAGTVLVAVEGASLRLIAATPATGWRVEVEVNAGQEVEVDFRSGAQRVQVNVEIEDGHVRERVRVRDDAADTDVRTENGAVVRDDSGDSSGPGSEDDRDEDHSGRGGDDEDHSGSGRDHPEDD